jgi:ParB-like chromosome segregation protein Spo0J
MPVLIRRQVVTSTTDGFVRSGMVRFHAGLEPLMYPIDEVTPAPYNFNNGDLDAITQSVETSGMYRPIYVQRSSGHIIAGNHTWMACKALGADTVPIVFLDVDDVQAKRIMVADNQTANLAQPDNGLLMALLDEINDEAGDLTGTGFTDRDLETLRALNEIPLETDEFGQWPTFTVKLPPNVLRAFMYLTDEADDDRARFELLLRLAGWDGS